MTRPWPMQENRNTILAVILSGLVLIGWQYFYNLPQMEKRKAAEQTQSELAKQSPQQQGTTTPQQGGSAPPAQMPASAQGNAPVVDRATAIGDAPRVKIDTPKIVGSISLKGARIDDISLVQYRETVDPNSPAIVLFSPSGTAEPYYAEFGWVAASGSTVKVPDRDTMWQLDGSNSLTPNT